LVKAGEYHGSPVLYEHVFKTLTVGGIEVDNVDLMIQSGARPYVGAQLALGMDILRQLHLYVAYKERNLYASAANAAAPLAQATQQSPTAQAH
jgi:predicted aspartyl protease